MFNLKEFLESENIPKARLAKMAGLSVDTISNVCKHERALESTVIKICDALKIKYDPSDWNVASIAVIRSGKRKRQTRKRNGYYDFSKPWNEGDKTFIEFRSGNKIKGEVLKKYDTWALIEIRFKNGIKIKKGFNYIDLCKAS